MLLHADFDAELHDWLFIMYPISLLTYPMIIGTIWHDKKGRFADGRTIQTSALLTPPKQVQAGAVIQTLNTRYLLVGEPARRN